MESLAQHYDEIVRTLTGGGIVVLRTDTIYGIVAQANNQVAVKKVFAAKQRPDEKTAIVLISSIDQLFDQPGRTCDTSWPGPYSIILPAPSAPIWLHREDNTVAYRMPQPAELRAIIAQTGPLIAPSANINGGVPAATIAQAKAYFGDTVDLYVDGGVVPRNTPPSQLLRLRDNGAVERLR